MRVMRRTLVGAARTSPAFMLHNGLCQNLLVELRNQPPDVAGLLAPAMDTPGDIEVVRRRLDGSRRKSVVTIAKPLEPPLSLRREAALFAGSVKRA